MEEIGPAIEATQRQKENGSLETGITQKKGLVNDITSMLETLDPPLTSGCCIYKVPDKIRKLNEAAYSPRVVSIGPFHNGDKRLKSMEKLKPKYLKSFLERTGVELEDYIGILKDWEDSIRSCYAETIEPDSDILVKMILIDSCFILELFLRHSLDDWSEEDPFLLKPWLINDITQDLFLLENQIPFFVLQNLFNIASESESSQSNQNFPSFIKLTLNYFKVENQQNISIIGVAFASVKHFTDLLRQFYLPALRKLPDRENKLVKHLYSASELHVAGLKFKASSKKCLLELQFSESEGVLEMACFEVYDNTETYIRNVVALEQCHYYYNAYITDYIVLLDFLINTSRDVDMLVKKGIIINGLGESQKVATMMNGFCSNLTLSDMNCHYYRLCDKLNRFYDDPRHKWKAILKREYFSTPWKIASSTAAILLLLLTLIQTICSIISLL